MYANLRASFVFESCVPHVPTCFTRSRILRACLPSCLCFLRAFLLICMSHMPSFLYVPYFIIIITTIIIIIIIIIIINSLFYIGYMQIALQILQSNLNQLTKLSKNNYIIT